MKILSKTEFHLETERLILRNWEERDRDFFHFINSDETVMKFFPFRRTREQSDKLMDTLQDNIRERGFGFAALEKKDTGECIGFCGLNACHLEPVLPVETIEIGWRLSPDHWGNGYVTESALKNLEFGFNELQLGEIVSFAVRGNEKSFAVMERIGMKRDPARDYVHPHIDDTYADLKQHLFYYIRPPQ